MEDTNPINQVADEVTSLIPNVQHLRDYHEWEREDNGMTREVYPFFNSPLPDLFIQLNQQLHHIKTMKDDEDEYKRSADVVEILVKEIISSLQQTGNQSNGFGNRSNYSEKLARSLGIDTYSIVKCTHRLSALLRK